MVDEKKIEDVNFNANLKLDFYRNEAYENELTKYGFMKKIFQVIKAIYEANGIPLAYYPAEGVGHGAWDFEFNNKRLEALVFDFLVEQQNLNVE